MDSFVDERDFNILEDDKYTFFMLRRIIGGKCELLMTDHERLIICFTSKPFPIWICSHALHRCRLYRVECLL